MTLRLLYLLFCQVLRWLELLMLRHEVSALWRQVPGRALTGPTARYWPAWRGCCLDRWSVSGVF